MNFEIYYYNDREWIREEHNKTEVSMHTVENGK
jgi:hypothetical protein